MKASEIRRRFLDYFQLRGHELRPSGPLVPADDPTLLFTNAGMVQFKEVFLGKEKVPYRRAVTAQKCVRAGGKHNDLEQVGRTARHHTFFEMLGNFSFGDYFKRDAIHFAWEFLTDELGMDPERLFVTVHHTDDEAHTLWQDVAGVPVSRIYRLGDKDNFWQMAETGPCGPCSELHYDLREAGERSIPSPEEFEALGERGVFIELWNLVFMQFNRDEEGNLDPLPAPSIDTGAGLERLAAVLQGVRSNYHTDLFRPLLERVGEVVGRPYQAEAREGMSFRVLADHARAVAFLLADGVFPSNEGRGYVLRRILRRGVRHAWILDRREPTLVRVVERVIDIMGDHYRELEEGRSHILQVVRQEEERFLTTIEGGMERFDVLAPDTGSAPPEEERVIPGEEVFKLYDTFGFPPDLTRLMARERGYEIDMEGFEQALERQRARSRADRAAGAGGVEARTLDDWNVLTGEPRQDWVGWEARTAETRVLAVGREEDGTALILERNPFYARAGGQVSDTGVVEGEGWRLLVQDVVRVEGFSAVVGPLEGELPAAREPFPARARVDEEARHDTERHHTATHLLHAALREVLGDHVTQRGSLVAPDRLRFDFSHPRPVTSDELQQVEDRVNEVIWADRPVRWEILPRDEALERGAMALFGEKYGDEVRVVEIPQVSLELCGGTHLRHTAEAGLFTVVREAGVAAGVRRIEALSGPHAFRHLQGAREELDELARSLRASRENLPRRIEELQREKAELESLLEELRTGGNGGAATVHEARLAASDGDAVRYRGLRMKVKDADDARAYGDAFRDEESGAVAVIASETPDGKQAFFVFVTDDLISRGVKAGDLVRHIAAVTGGRGGGRPHMAQGGVEDAEKVDEALTRGEEILRKVLEDGA